MSDQVYRIESHCSSLDSHFLKIRLYFRWQLKVPIWHASKQCHIHFCIPSFSQNKYGKSSWVSSPATVRQYSMEVWFFIELETFNNRVHLLQKLKSINVILIIWGIPVNFIFIRTFVAFYHRFLNKIIIAEIIIFSLIFTFGVRRVCM